MQQSNQNFESGEAEDVSLGDLLYKFLPYWPIFVLLLIISLSAAWVYLRYKIPDYETSASLLIKDDKSSSPADEMMQAFDMFGAKKSVDNEVEVLESKTLMQEVVKNLHLYAPVTVQGRVRDQSAYLLSPIVIEAKDPDSIKPEKKIEFTYNELARSITTEGTTFPLNQWEVTPFGVLRFLPNNYYRPVSVNEHKNSDFYFSLVSVKNAANDILKQVTIASSSKESTVIGLSIVGAVPKRGEDILNELLTVYNKAAVLDKNVLSANTLKFVEDRLKLVSSDLDSVEGSLQRFKAKNKITDISAQGQIYLQTVAANDQKVSDVNMQLAMLDEVEKYINNKGDIGGIVPPSIEMPGIIETGGVVPSTSGIDDPVLTSLLQKLSDLQLQYTQTKKIVPENNPAVVALVDGINKIRPQILENIKSQRRNLVAGRDDMAATNNQYASMLKTIPEKERELLSISRQQSIKNDIYTFLLKRREETALSFASTVADSRIIDKAESSDTPVSPKRNLIYLGALFIAVVLGFAIIYIKDILTRTVQDRTEIEKYTALPVLGEVVYDRNKAPIVIAEGTRSFIAEEFRQLRTSLNYMGVNETHKKIMLTSSITGEGKSFISVNLGISLSLMQKKVVLIELDLRKPKLSEIFNVSRHGGLSAYLIGKAAMEETVKPTGINNLFLVPSGPIPPNPSELISNGRLKELLTYLDAQFDYIVIDTAPVNPVTDAFILSHLCDVTLYVVRHAYTPKVFLEKLDEKLKTKNLKNPAIVYNGVKVKGFGKYGYGYGYGYGYTEDLNNRKWWKKKKN